MAVWGAERCRHAQNKSYVKQTFVLYWSKYPYVLLKLVKLREYKINTNEIVTIFGIVGITTRLVQIIALLGRWATFESQGSSTGIPRCPWKCPRKSAGSRYLPSRHPNCLHHLSPTTDRSGIITVQVLQHLSRLPECGGWKWEWYLCYCQRMLVVVRTV